MHQQEPVFSKSFTAPAKYERTPADVEAERKATEAWVRSSAGAMAIGTQLAPPTPVAEQPKEVVPVEKVDIV